MSDQLDNIFASVNLDNVCKNYTVIKVGNNTYETTRFGNNKYLTEAGYVIVKKNKKFHFEHRKVVEKVLGRQLKAGEQVHHINGCKVDNRPQNLLVCTEEYHLDLHKRCQIRFNSWHLNLPCYKPETTTDGLWGCYHKREEYNKTRARRNSRSSVNVTPTDSSFLN